MSSNSWSPSWVGVGLIAGLTACGGGGSSPSEPASEGVTGTGRNVSVAATTASSTVVVRARATLAGGVGATMVVRADGQILGSVTVSNVAAMQDYRFQAPSPLADGARIDVAFVNDGVTVVNGVRTEDRNLFVESIAVDARPPIPSSATGVVLDKGDGSFAFDGLDTLPGQAALAWNGALRFVLPTTSSAASTLKVRASASLAGGVGAQMQIRVDGQTVGGATVSNVGAPQEFAFALASTPAPGARIDVVFVNDGVTVVNGVRTEDRNLYVESITLDTAAPILPTAPGVTLDRGTGAAAFDGLDVIPGQRALAWNGALRFTLPGAPTGNKITVRARAVYPMGVGALMNVRHNGVLLTATPQVVNASGVSPEPIDIGVAQDYVVNSSQPVRDGDTLEVIAVNAGTSTTCTSACGTRQLVVEGISINDQEPIASTASDVVFDRGEGAAAFDGLDLLPGQQALAENGALRFKVRPVTASLPMAERLQAARLAFMGVTNALGVTTSCASGTAAVTENLTKVADIDLGNGQIQHDRAGTRDVSYTDCASPGGYGTRNGSIHSTFESTLLTGYLVPDEKLSVAYTSVRVSMLDHAMPKLEFLPSSAGVLLNGSAQWSNAHTSTSTASNPVFAWSWRPQAGLTLTDPTSGAKASFVSGEVQGISAGYGIVSNRQALDFSFDLASRRYVTSGTLEQYWGGRFGTVMSYRGGHEIRNNGNLIGEVRVIDTQRDWNAPRFRAYLSIDGFTYPI